MSAENVRRAYLRGATTPDAPIATSIAVERAFDRWLAEERRAATEKTLEPVRALHHKITRYGNEDYSISAESYAEDPDSYGHLEAFDLCAECYAVEELICEVCGGEAAIGHRSAWPCPTIRAIETKEVTPDGR